MPTSRSETSLIRRGALGFWFCGLAALGFLRFFMKASREPAFTPDPAAWLWLAGSVVLSAIGIVLVVREIRRRPRSSD